MKHSITNPFRFHSRLWLAAAVSVLLFAGCRKDNDNINPLPEVESEDIVILFDNDVHCAIDGYAKMASLKKAAQEQTDNVCVVSCGDFIQGQAYGILSQGEYPITLMNAVGYDFVTLGNHEFDYGIGHMVELIQKLNAEVLCANFVRISDQQPLFALSAMKVFTTGTVAFIGVATPQSISSSVPAYFQDDQGNFKYSFCESELANIVQKEVDRVRNAGADYVVVLSHLGDTRRGYTASQDLISKTSGIDFVLDGHSHSVIPCDSVLNKAGKYVKRSSTGTAFANIGRVTISSRGKISAGLIDTKNLSDDPIVEVLVNNIKETVKSILSKVVGTAEVALNITNAEGKRIVRNQEAGIGDLAADAFRSYLNSDIGWVNGGNLRADIPQGTITFGNILNVFPFGNTVLLGRITGQVFLDNLEMSYRLAPAESGGFAQLSGVQCDLDTTVASSVVLSPEGILQSVGDRRRVKNVKILNRNTNQYEPIDPSKEYTIAAANYVLVQNGDGQNFKGVSVISSQQTLNDCDVLANFIKETLGGTIGRQYAVPQGRINCVGRR